jgi:CheY-like chemotaxis protein/two-component sensor histidine kinase
MKDEFLANMSHEFRTPLNAILGFSEALRDQIYGELNPKQEKVLNIIEESGQHLLELINDILDLSKITTGNFELYISSISVEELCNKSIQLVKQMAKRKNIHVSLMLDENVKYIQADERRLKQILLNLLSNAVKYTEPDGEVGLEVKGDTENQWVHFVVWDTGIGIEEKDLRKIFTPFTQLDSKLSRKYSGTGLGLALVKRLVEMHGGKIDVESESRKGTRFVISMPWKKSVDVVSKIVLQSSSKRASAPPTEREIQILIAEDNEINIMALSDYLTRKNYNVILAKNGVEAVEKAKAHTPDIVLMDVQMPEMDGLEAIRHIRFSEDDRVNSVPIISLTGMAMVGDNEKCLAAGADHYISKPFRMSDLIELINSLLGASD